VTARVLIVDDNVYLSHLLQRMLGEEGYEVEAARSAPEGYSAYLRKRPDVILTDIHMPGGSGLEMMKQIRSHDPEVRAIYMSGDWACLQAAMDQEKRKSLVKSLRKPFLQEELLEVLAETLSPEGENMPRETRDAVRTGSQPGNTPPLALGSPKAEKDPTSSLRPAPTPLTGLQSWSVKASGCRRPGDLITFKMLSDCFSRLTP
jgi:DNA-binding NtrC family response regulator